jgi:hypothetical protein
VPFFSPEKALVHCIKTQNFLQKKMLFLQLNVGKTWNFLPGKRILALEFSNFSGGGFGFGAR